jgi:hypothetical protein
LIFFVKTIFTFFLFQGLIQNLETYVDLKQELNQLETKVSIVSLIHNYNQYIDKRKQLLSNAQVCFYLSYWESLELNIVFIECIDSSSGSS